MERKSSIRGGREREGERDFRGFEAMQIERKSSIEKEPRTLSFHQIQYARVRTKKKYYMSWAAFY